MRQARFSLPAQRNLFLLASGLSTMGSFAGLTAKGWVLMSGTNNPLIVALQFAVLALPTLVVSGPAGVLTDRHGCERVLVWAQFGLLGGALVGALAMPFSSGALQAALLLLSTLLVGIASAYELTARNKYCALLVQHPGELGSYLTSFSVVFNVGKLVGPPVGGLLVALTGPALALLLDASTYILPIVSVVWLLEPLREQEQRSQQGESASLWAAWRGCGADLRHVLRFTALFCLVGFFHPGLGSCDGSGFHWSRPARSGPLHQCVGRRQHHRWRAAAAQQLSAQPTACVAARQQCPADVPGSAGPRHRRTPRLDPGDGLFDWLGNGRAALWHQLDHPSRISPSAARTHGRAWPNCVFGRRRPQRAARRGINDALGPWRHLRGARSHWPGDCRPRAVSARPRPAEAGV